MFAMVQVGQFSTGGVGQFYSGANICYIAVYKHCVNLGFTKGAMLIDRHNRLLGSGKAMRHIRLSSENDLDDAYVRSLIVAASILALNEA